MIYKITNKITIVPFVNLMQNDNKAFKQYISFFNDPEINKFTSHAVYPFTPQMAREYINYTEQELQKIIVWSVIYKNKYVGNVCLQSINHINKSAEIGIMIGDKTVHGKGIATTVLRQIIKHGFKKLGLNRIWLGTPSLNYAMKRAALKVGMQYESTEKMAFWYIDDYIDIVRYSILFKDWKINKE